MLRHLAHRILLDLADLADAFSAAFDELAQIIER